MPDAWITSTMPPTAGVYDVTIQVGAGRNCKRATASAYWPGRRSKRWQLLDMSIDDGVILAWSARKVPYSVRTRESVSQQELTRQRARQFGYAHERIYAAFACSAFAAVSC